MTYNYIVHIEVEISFKHIAIQYFKKNNVLAQICYDQLSDWEIEGLLQNATKNNLFGQFLWNNVCGIYKG